MLPRLLVSLLLVAVLASHTKNTLGDVQSVDQPLDLLISGGLVVDGTGAPGRVADVGIREGRIVAVGKLSSHASRRTIDARGLVVAPGFIDMLGQSELALLVDPRAESKIRQGITTEITGEGFSVAPQNEKTLPELEQTAKAFGLTIGWRTLSEYFARLERQGLAINFGTNVGAAQVRRAVLGDANRVPTAAELAAMKQLVAEAMEQGAIGLSTSLIYVPGIFARTGELVGLARVAAQHGGVYSTHLRSEGQGIFAALEEAFRIGREARIPVHIYHLKVASRGMRGRMGDVIARIEGARRDGLGVTADVYPYTASATSLSSLLPAWVLEGGTEKALARLAAPAIGPRIRANVAKRIGSGNHILISLVLNEKLKPLEGKRLPEAARLRGQSVADALISILGEDRLQTAAILFTMSEQDVERAIPVAWVSFGCDFPALRPDGILGSFPAHPRGYGTFPRILARYVREKKLMTLEAAIHKMTALPAETMRIADRGVLKPGMRADVVVFDFAAVRDVATFEQPNRYSEGVRYVVVNGQLVLDDGRMTGALPGQILRGLGYGKGRGGTPQH